MFFLKKLREVFDVCDEDGDGYVRTEHIVDLGLQFGQGDEVRSPRVQTDKRKIGTIIPRSPRYTFCIEANKIYYVSAIIELDWLKMGNMYEH